MSRIEETALPGVGVRHVFTTADGVRVGVLTHRSGRRELLVYDAGDPDACRLSLQLDADDSRVLAELLGGSAVSEQVAAMQRLEGLALDWIEVRAGGPADGRAIADLAVRTRTGVSIVAVLRDTTTVPAPDPAFVLGGGDTVVVVGRPDGIRDAVALLRG